MTHRLMNAFLISMLPLFFIQYNPLYEMGVIDWLNLLAWYRYSLLFDRCMVLSLSKKTWLVLYIFRFFCTCCRKDGLIDCFFTGKIFDECYAFL